MQSSSANSENTRVWLVGAGPGDADLITLRGLSALKNAQVVVYDALIDPSLLELAPAQALRVDAGKRAKRHTLTQDQINALLVEHARAGRRVVRLKGGDPVLFGRGAEEAAACAAAGIAVEIVPGITSGLAAPTLAGIPVTHRDYASSVTLVTGHEEPGKEAGGERGEVGEVGEAGEAVTSVDYAALAALARRGGTLCFYMAAARSGAIARRLMEQGLPGETPCAMVHWGGTPRQRSVRSTLAKLEREALPAPSILVVGAVAGRDEPGMMGYARRPLMGQRIVVTRSRDQASALSEQLRERGAMVMEAPTIELVPPEDWGEVDKALRRIAEHDWLVLTSVNGVEAVAERLAAMELDARALAGVKVAVIGESVRASVRERLGVRADLMPQRFVGEALAEALIDARARRPLLLRADIARPALPRMLTEAGAAVTEVVVYRTRQPEALPAAVVEALERGEVDWVTFTSSSTAENLVLMLGERARLLSRCRRASMGPITSQALHRLGLPPTVEAKTSTIPALVQAIETAAE